MGRLSLKQKMQPKADFKQTQKILMSQTMQQGIFLLQIPNLELAAVIETELETNPLLEILSEEEAIEEEEFQEDDTEEEIENKEIDFSEKDFDILKRLDEDFKEHFQQSETFDSNSKDNDLKNYIEASIVSKETLFDYLHRQARETFQNEEELNAAILIMGSLDERGLLRSPLSELSALSGIEESFLQAILKVVQTFDPPGVAATSLKESLLTQLEIKHLKKTLAYSIIENEFESLLQGKLLKIAKSLKKDPKEVASEIKNRISHLDLSPGLSFSSELIQNIFPEIIVREEDGILKVEVPKEGRPELKIKREYLKLAESDSLSDEEKRFFKQKIASARSLLKNLSQRESTLKRIGEWLIQNQKDFFLKPEGKLKPFSMLDLAKDLELHESTIARAVSSKYLSCDRGIFALRNFFSVAYTAANGEDISSKTIKDLIESLIKEEDKGLPLSDEVISQKLREQGIFCARRTVAKYRKSLQLGNTKQRKRHF
ncbi:RNA polymerase factor sigma-54 [Criblamydia sequanensis]|uniref:RNA polymerase sigma-54 factor n=1 Tax=Candidatus Criblamydia sequanensis CRIB-18 TaxID=1437425 RepID=A0A090D2N9_9BACT|nr:RNA polymerase factor sigma-54 [Criblamydia sequanensis]CDR34543.1 RNA polymerase sigma-54 factor [Criblamydia sequanensis CRIB-18]